MDKKALIWILQDLVISSGKDKEWEKYMYKRIDEVFAEPAALVEQKTEHKHCWDSKYLTTHNDDKKCCWCAGGFKEPSETEPEQVCSGGKCGLCSNCEPIKETGENEKKCNDCKENYHYTSFMISQTYQKGREDLKRELLEKAKRINLTPFQEMLKVLLKQT